MRTANSSGYLKGGNGCGRTIYMKEDSDGKWRPYESWIAGTCCEGEWVVHSCGTRALSVHDAKAAKSRVLGPVGVAFRLLPVAQT